MDIFLKISTAPTAYKTQLGSGLMFEDQHGDYVQVDVAGVPPDLLQDAFAEVLRYMRGDE